MKYWWCVCIDRFDGCFHVCCKNSLLPLTEEPVLEMGLFLKQTGLFLDLKGILMSLLAWVVGLFWIGTGLGFHLWFFGWGDGFVIHFSIWFGCFLNLGDLELRHLSIGCTSLTLNDPRANCRKIYYVGSIQHLYLFLSPCKHSYRLISLTVQYYAIF